MSDPKEIFPMVWFGADKRNPSEDEKAPPANQQFDLVKKDFRPVARTSARPEGIITGDQSDPKGSTVTGGATLVRLNPEQSEEPIVPVEKDQITPSSSDDAETKTGGGSVVQLVTVQLPAQ